MERGVRASFGRCLNYVRISITDRCNFRCRYCMPPEGVPQLSHRAIMSYEDILYLSEVLYSMGIGRIRFTGGEPFVRKDFVPFLERLKAMLPDLSIAVTTNGALVAPWAGRLGSLGLDGISVSLDSLRADRFESITRGGCLENVLAGVKALVESSNDVKINTVIIKGFNDDELPELLDFARSNRVLLRLIEFMPLDSNVWLDDAFVSVDEIIGRLPDREFWMPDKPLGNVISGPSVYYSNVKTGQRLGLIAAVSHHFCDDCNRLRITSDGEVRSCLFDEKGTNVMKSIRERRKVDLIETIEGCALEKPRCWTDIACGNSHMSRIGG